LKKICVIGTGNWGMNHVRTLNELHSLGGIVELDDEKRYFCQWFLIYLGQHSRYDNHDDGVSG